MDSLVTIPISKVQAIQRKGRAGRTQSGKCLRGSSENDYPKIAGNLKETTSTSSAETMIIQKKQAPAFLKCKSKAMLNKKISDSRLDRDNFKIIKKLGQGKFGRVLMVL